MTREELGRKNYAAYCRAVGGLTHDGKPMPTWETVPGSGAPVLTPKIREGWIAGALEVAAEVRSEFTGLAE